MKRLLLILFLIGLYVNVYALTVIHLRVNSVVNPCGIYEKPLFSWQLQSDQRACYQEAYRIKILTDDESLVYDTGNQESSESTHVVIEGLSLNPSTRYFWEVWVRDNYGETATSIEQAYFETGLMDIGWSGAQWITNSSLVGSVPRFRRIVNITKEVKTAFLYTSALGIYDVFINGKRIGHSNPDGTAFYEELKPGWTDYHKAINYSAHNAGSNSE